MCAIYLAFNVYFKQSFKLNNDFILLCNLKQVIQLLEGQTT